MFAALSLTVLSACRGGGDADSPVTIQTPVSSPAPSSSPSPSTPSGNPSPTPSPTQDSTVGACQSFKEVNAKVATGVDNTLTSSISNAGNVIDGDLGTSATLVVNGSTSVTQGVRIRAMAQSGIVFPAGKTAGAFYSVPSGTARSYTVTIKTLLGSEVQESNSIDNSGGGCGICGGHSKNFNGIVTTKPFDAVEVVVSNTQIEASPKFEVFEICSDHGK